MAWAGGRAPFGPAGNQQCFLFVAGALLRVGGLFLQAGELGAFVMHADRAPVHVEVFTRVLDEGEAQPRLQAHIVAFHFGNACIMAQGREAGGSERNPDRITLVSAGVVEALIVQRLMGVAIVVSLVFLTVLWMSEGVVPLHLPRCSNLFAVTQAPQARPGLIAASNGSVQHLIGAHVVIVKPFILIIGLDGPRLIWPSASSRSVMISKCCFGVWSKR